MKIKTVKMIDVNDWDDFVQKTYGRPYNYQQQNGCQNRGTFNLTVPSEEANDYENDAVPEIVNGPEMGVSFAAWLKRDPKQPLNDDKETVYINLWWARNFYPDIEVVANDLHAKGLLEAGEYVINIDW